ncbi:MAG: PLP-dependent transferase [Fusobacteriaceae bacterium]
MEKKIIEIIDLEKKSTKIKDIFQEILEEGDHILIDESLEGLKEIFSKTNFNFLNLEIDFVDIRNFNILKNCIKFNTKAIYFQISSEKEEELKIIEDIGDIVKNISSELKFLVGKEENVK